MSLYEDVSNYVGAVGSTAGALWGLFTNPTPPEDTSVIKLDDFTLPGIVQNEDLERELDVEFVPIEDLSGSVKLVHGHRDAVLRYVITLVNDDLPDSLVEQIGTLLSGDFAAALELLQGSNQQIWTAVQKLQALDWFFRQYQSDGSGVKVWKITQEMANANGITQVLFTGMRPGRTSASDKIEVSLDFTEYQPATVLIETGAAPAQSTPPPQVTTNPLE